MPQVGVEFYADEDGDGYGVMAKPSWCTADLTGVYIVVVVLEDCDDTNPCQSR